MRAFVLFFFFIAFCYACRNADPCVAYTTKQDSSTSLSVLIKPQSPCKNRDSLFLIVLGLSGTLCTLFWAIHLLLPFVIACACFVAFADTYFFYCILHAKSFTVGIVLLVLIGGVVILKKFGGRWHEKQYEVLQKMNAEL